MTSHPNQRKASENAIRRNRSIKRGQAQRLIRGAIDRVAEEAAIEAAIREGKITRLPAADRLEREPTARSHTHYMSVKPSEGMSFGDRSRRTSR